MQIGKLPRLDRSAKSPAASTAAKGAAAREVAAQGEARVGGLVPRPDSVTIGAHQGGVDVKALVSTAKQAPSASEERLEAVRGRLASGDLDSAASHREAAEGFLDE